MNTIAAALITHRPKTTAACAALTAAAAAAWLAGQRAALGPLAAATAAAIAAVYTAAALTACHRTLRRRRRREARKTAADTVAYLAADLAAGTDPARALAAAEPDWPDETRTARRLKAALNVAAELGAPAADLCRRLADHLREDDQAGARAGAQTASIRATAALLIALPAAGVAFGELLGVDALAFLLAEPAGIAAAAAAMGLQAAGLAWTSVLIKSVRIGGA